MGKGAQSRLGTKESMLLNCGAGEDSWESLGLQGDPTSSQKANQPWIFIGGTAAKAEAPILWPPDGKSRLIGKGPDAGKDWGQEKKGTTEDKMVGWCHRLKGHEFEQIQEIVKDRKAWSAEVHRVTKSQTQFFNWTTAMYVNAIKYYVAIDRNDVVLY